MRLRHLALPAAAGLTLLAIPFAPAASAETATKCDPSVNSCLAAFTYGTDAPQTFQVPAGVTNLLTLAGGAAGGNGLEAPIDDAPEGGAGGAVAALVPVTPGETLTLVVGGRGGDAALNNGTPAAGGYGGGGTGTAGTTGPSGGGGGGTFVFDGSGKLLLAVGGGGGAGYTGTSETSSTGGTGGASAGTAGAGDNGGGGATATAGGSAGAGDRGAAGAGPATSPTALGNGGAAVLCPAGGGGGGFFGGGSGSCTIIDTDQTIAGKPAARAAADAAPAALLTSNAGGGGGGAGYLGEGVSAVADSGLTTNNLPDGAVVFQYTTAATTTTLTTNDNTLAPGQEATLSAKVTGPALTIVGDDEQTDQEAKAAAVAKSAFSSAGVKALAVPSQPAAPGTTLTPSTACGTTPCTVTFFVNGKALTTPITVDPATGVATAVFTAGSDLGVRNITAQYNGNFYYLQSTSNQVTITVAGLANTGVNDIAPMIGTAAGLLVLGAGLLAYGRRRPAFGSHRAA